MTSGLMKIENIWFPRQLRRSRINNGQGQIKDKNGHRIVQGQTKDKNSHRIGQDQMKDKLVTE